MSKLEYEDFTTEELNAMDPQRREVLYTTKIQLCYDDLHGTLPDNEIGSGCPTCGGFGFARQPFDRSKDGTS